MAAMDGEANGEANGAKEIGRTMYSTGVHFHASLYDFLTKDATVKDLHIVSRMTGEAKDSFVYNMCDFAFLFV